MPVDDLLNTLKNGSPGDPDAQWRAAIALGNTKGDDRVQAVAALLDLLTSGGAHALTRSHAVEALGRLGDAQAVPVLLNALNDDYRLVRAYAASALGRMADSEEAVRRLLKCLESDEYFGVRAESAEAVAMITLRRGDAGLIERVRKSLEDRRAFELANPVSRVDRVVAKIEFALMKLSNSLQS